MKFNTYLIVLVIHFYLKLTLIVLLLSCKLIVLYTILYYGRHTIMQDKEINILINLT